MRTRLFNDKWEFLKTELGTEIDKVLLNTKDFYPVTIPHDWLIYDGKDLYQNGIGWYKRIFSLDEIIDNQLKYKSGDKIFLIFDGVYMNSTFYVNGKEVFSWKYGYSAFCIDITDAVNEGENILVMKVVHESPNSRWYSGAGIFRNIEIRVSDSTYIPWGGNYVSIKETDGDDGQAFWLNLETEVINADSETEIEAELFYKGASVLKLCKPSVMLTDEKGTHIRAGKDVTVYNTDGIIYNPKLWDVDAPERYLLRVTLYKGGSILETEDITVGFKKIEFTTDKGFYLNGRYLRLHGVCEHHDLGCLGSAFNEDALRRQFRILKEMGVNSIRTSHNMPAKEFMDIADEMGFLIVSEAFDMWARCKTEFDYARFFNEWVEKDVESWIRRDRNHPSLLMWSIGNEIYDTHAGEEGFEITKKLMALVDKHDPYKNAVVTLGSNYMPWENTQKCAELYKFAGYNYGAKYYDEHHEKHPDWIMYGSETASMVMSRGVYHFPFSQPVLADDDEQCSSLGNSTTSWGARNVESCIAEDRDVPYLLGQYLWTGFDYIGEPTPYHTRNSYFGMVDTAGFKKDPFYVFQAEWTDAKTNPMVHIFPYWDFNPGQPVDIRVCSNGKRVELFVNDKSYGVKELNHDYGQDFTGTWTVPYEKGYIKAVAYDEDNNVIAEEVRKSFGDSKAIVIRSDKDIINADGRSLCFIEISTIDENGNPVENAMDYITVKVSGNGYLAGLDNGDSTDYDHYKCSKRKLFNGKLLAVIQSGTGTGDVEILVSGEGIEGASKVIKTASVERIPGTSDEDVLKLEAKRLQMAEITTGRIPARKVELICNDSLILNKEHDTVLVNAVIYPENTTDKEVEFRAVNDAGIDVNFIDVISDVNDRYKVLLKAKGDGEFWLRALSKDNIDGKVRLISQLKLKAQDLGTAYLNPYEFITGGLYSSAIGDIGNGNEKGFCTSNDGTSSVMFKNVDFGEIGSDEITIPVFTLNNEPYPFKIYDGLPAHGKVLLDGVYRKDYIWNVYQEETFKLPERVKGLKDISIEFYNKAHVKGFVFKKYEKAYEKLNAAGCTKVYGDNYHIEDVAITGIGNNVTVNFEDMNFLEKPATSITISGKSDLDVNSIHIQFIFKDGSSTRQIVEFKGSKEYNEQTFELNPVSGECTVAFVFLPGSQFDFEYFRFQ